jgi:hypothetical protein
MKLNSFETEHDNKLLIFSRRNLSIHTQTDYKVIKFQVWNNKMSLNFLQGLIPS